MGDSHGTAAFIWAATAIVRMLSRDPTAVANTPLTYQPVSLQYDHMNNHIFDIKGRIIRDAGIDRIILNNKKTTNGIYIQNGKRYIMAQ